MKARGYTYDTMTETITDDSTGKIVYRENGIGEVDMRDVARGIETWESGAPYTFDDFLTEILGIY